MMWALVSAAFDLWRKSENGQRPIISAVTPYLVTPRNGARLAKIMLGGWKAPSVDGESAHAILAAFSGNPVMEPKPAPLTPSEYLDREGRSPIKREYVDGESTQRPARSAGTI
jgi:hypothetical protein